MPPKQGSKAIGTSVLPPKSAFLINLELFAIDCRRQLFVKVGFILRPPSAFIFSSIVFTME